MSALSVDTAARVAKFVPTLSSDKAGEVVAAAAAIGRALKAGGADWHDLAEHLKRVAPAVVYVNAFGQRTKAPSDTPPLFEALKRSAKIAWLEHAVAFDRLDDAEQALCVAIRAQTFSQPHKTVPPRHCAAISVVLGKLWMAGVRV